MEIREGHSMYLLRRMLGAVGADAIERGGGVGHHPGRKVQIAGHTRSGRDAVISRQSNDHQPEASGVTQIGLEGRSDEGAVHALLDHRLARQGSRLGLELVPGLTGPKRRQGISRHVAHVHDSPPARSPGAQQLGGTLLHRGVVAPAPARVAEALLEVNDQQGGVVGFE